MSLNRSEKQAVIDEVTGLAAKAQTLVMAEYRGITVADMTRLRSQARGNGVTLSVLKTLWHAAPSQAAHLKFCPTR